MSSESSLLPTGQELTSTLREEERQAQELFDASIDASNSLAAGTLSDALHRGLGYAYCVANAQGGKLREKEIFELVELLQKGASYTRAGLLLLRSGHLAECIATARQLAEGCNLVMLFEACSNQLTEFLDADESGRADQFRVGRVREKLSICGGYDLFNDVTYKVLSERFTHFSTSSVYLNTFSPNPLKVDLGFIQGMNTNVMTILAGLFLMFLRSTLTLLKYSPEDPMAKTVVRELTDAVYGMPFYLHSTE